MPRGVPSYIWRFGSECTNCVIQHQCRTLSLLRAQKHSSSGMLNAPDNREKCQLNVRAGVQIVRVITRKDT